MRDTRAIANADRATALGRIGDHEAADDEEELDAEITIFRDRNEVGQRDVGEAIGDRAAKPIVEQQHGRDREQAQEIEDFDAPLRRGFGVVACG